MSTLTNSNGDEIKYQTIAEQVAHFSSLNALKFMKKNTKYQEILRKRKSTLMANNLMLAAVAAVTVTLAATFSWHFTFVGMAVLIAYFLMNSKKERAVSYKDDLTEMLKESRHDLEAFLQNFIFTKYGKIAPLSSYSAVVNHDQKVPLRESIVISGKHLMNGYYSEVIVTLVFNDTLTSLNPVTFQFSNLGKRVIA